MDAVYIMCFQVTVHFACMYSFHLILSSLVPLSTFPFSRKTLAVFVLSLSSTARRLSPRSLLAFHTCIHSVSYLDQLVTKAQNRHNKRLFVLAHELQRYQHFFLCDQCFWYGYTLPFHSRQVNDGCH